MDEPANTIVPTGNAANLVAAWMIQHNGGATGHEVGEPVSTLTQQCTQQQLATSHLMIMRHNQDGQSVTEPMKTLTSCANHFAEVRAFLLKYFTGGTGQDLADPLHTVTTKDRFGLVTVNGCDYVIADIGMRMLTPRELFNAQGFPQAYILDPMYNGKPLTKTAQTRCCGNSVCPQVAEAIVLANYVPDQASLRKPRRVRDSFGQGVLAV